MNIEDIYNDLVNNYNKDNLLSFIEQHVKDPGYTTLIYWIKQGNSFIGDDKVIYSNYETWAVDNDLPYLSKNKFTRYLQGKHVFLSESIKDKKRIKRYTKMDSCPTCKRYFE